MTLPDTQMANYYKWRIGQEAIVRFGSLGAQRARCVGFDRAGRVVAVKYRAASNSWTKRVKIREEEFVRFA